MFSWLYRCETRPITGEKCQSYRQGVTVHSRCTPPHTSAPLNSSAAQCLLAKRRQQLQPQSAASHHAVSLSVIALYLDAASHRPWVNLYSHQMRSWGLFVVISRPLLRQNGPGSTQCLNSIGVIRCPGRDVYKRQYAMPRGLRFVTERRHRRDINQCL